MSGQRMIGGCLVLQEAPARELLRFKVVLCEIPLPPEPTEETPEPTEEIDSYVVWYLDLLGDHLNPAIRDHLESGQREGSF